MKLAIKLFLTIILCGGLVFSTFGQANKEKDIIFRAVESEMNRAMSGLKFKTFDKPYFLEYIVEEVDTLGIEATFGAIKKSRREKTRMLYTQVRVGNYELDNAGEYAFRFPFPMSKDNDYDSLRRSVWFVTDRSYKQAINMFEMVKAAKRNSTEDEDEKVPSFSKEKPIVLIEKRGKLEIDKEKWEKRVRDWSAMFRKYPQFRDSSVNFYVRQTNRYLINTEGTRILKPKLLITFDIHARALTANNTSVEPYRHMFAKSFDDMPSMEKVGKEIESLAQEIKNFEKIPQFKDTYIGPAIFTKGASVQLFLQLLSSNLSGGSFSDRIGRKVLPSFLSVIDDPTQTKFGNFKLAGNYKIDDEGVIAKPLTLIENGILKTLLMTRNPIKKIRNSNGRARGASVSGSSANISNLFIKSKDGKSFAELKKQLIEECKKQGLSYGVIFRENNATFSTYSGGSLIVHKVYVKDGREEVFKGASLQDLSSRELRNILAAGNDPFPFSFLLNSSYQGSGVPASVVAPSVLMEEVYLKKSKYTKEKPKLITHPFFNK